MTLPSGGSGEFASTSLDALRRIVHSWRVSMREPRWVRTLPAPVRAALVDDPRGRELVRSVRRSWLVHCCASALPYVALSLIAPLFPVASGLPGVSTRLGRVAAAMPYIGAYVAPVGLSQWVAGRKTNRLEHIAQYASQRVAAMAEGTWAEPRGDTALTPKQVEALDQAATSVYAALTGAAERTTHNSGVMIGCAVGALVAGPIAGLILAAIATPALVVLHRRASARQRAVIEQGELLGRGERFHISQAAAQAPESAIGMGLKREALPAMRDRQRAQIDALGSAVRVANQRNRLTQLASAALLVGFMVAGAATGIPFVNMLIASGAFTNIALCMGAIARDQVDFVHVLKPVSTVDALHRVARVFQQRWGGTESWRRPRRGPRITLREVAFDRVGEGVGEPVTLTIESGSLTVLIGPNGSGKSTWLRAFHADRVPASGEIDFDGEPLQKFSPQSIWDGSILISADAVEQFPLIVRRYVTGAAPGGVDALLDQLSGLGFGEDLSRELVRKPLTAAILSKGQRARLSFLAVPLAEADGRVLALFDETAANADIPGKSEAARIQREMASRGATVISAAHTPELVAVADRVVLLGERGQVIAACPPEELIPPVPYVAYGPAACKTAAQEWAYNTLTGGEIQALFERRVRRGGGAPPGHLRERLRRPATIPMGQRSVAGPTYHQQPRAFGAPGVRRVMTDGLQ